MPTCMVYYNVHKLLYNVHGVIHNPHKNSQAVKKGAFYYRIMVIPIINFFVLYYST